MKSIWPNRGVLSIAICAFAPVGTTPGFAQTKYMNPWEDWSKEVPVLRQSTEADHWVAYHNPK